MNSLEESIIDVTSTWIDIEKMRPYGVQRTLQELVKK